MGPRSSSRRLEGMRQRHRRWLILACCAGVASASAAGLVMVPVAANAASATASARPTRICTPQQTLGGDCGPLPLRSCLNLIPNSTFNRVTISSLEFEDPDWVSVAAPANTRTCAVRLSLVPPAPESPSQFVLGLCEAVNGAKCDFADTSEIYFSRYASQAQARRVLFKNFCVTETVTTLLPGDTIGKFQGLKACLNSQEGYAAVAADNIMVRLVGFGQPNANATATAAMSKVLAYLTH